ncbi:kinase-like domain-containing protein [Favolaschia claudopus]|uniref:Kinase-like domain-containing protein n=1 Tax=Favolaschia claudopus TaxID=2862362 RepID=A0AAW0AG64_9AGAR
MSPTNMTLNLCTFPSAAAADEARALANPPDPFKLWDPLDSANPKRFSSQNDTWRMSPGEPPEHGESSFVVDADPQVFGSGAAVTVSYDFNTDVAVCAENRALDGMRGLRYDVIDSILSKVKIHPGLRTYIAFRTLFDGSLDVSLDRVEPYPKAEVLPDSILLSVVALSSLRCTHALSWAPNVFLVKSVNVSETDSSDEIRVFKTSNGEESLAQNAEFMTRLPQVEFLLPPTHVVLDDAGGLHGLLLDHHPATSLRLVLYNLNPDAETLVLRPATRGLSQDTDNLPVPSVSWSVKLGWCTDTAACLAWLHSQQIFWGDLKTDNIILCKDGHCRLIDYSPGGRSDAWSASAAGDVFSLGLVLWSVAVEVDYFEREDSEFVSPLLLWNEETPLWFRTLVSSCVDDDCSMRPLARSVYERLTQQLGVLSTA